MGSPERIATAVTASDRWECVHFISQAQLAGIKTLRESGYHVAVIPGDSLVSSHALFRAVAGAFSFPNYFGENWDALVDCLEDLDWIDAKGYVLVVESSDAYGLTEPFARLISLWLAVAQEWASDGVPFHLVGVLGAPAGSAHA